MIGHGQNSGYYRQRQKSFLTHSSSPSLQHLLTKAYKQRQRRAINQSLIRLVIPPKWLICSRPLGYIMPTEEAKKLGFGETDQAQNNEP